MNHTITSDEARSPAAERRVTKGDRREDRGVSERRLMERRGLLSSMADALEDILRAEIRAGFYGSETAKPAHES